MISPTLTTFLICVLVASVTADSKEKVNSFILGLQTSDPFDLLAEDELQREWSHETTINIFEPHYFQDNIPVHVKLVGFEDEGGLANITRVELLRYLNALSFDDAVGVIHPLHAQQHQLFIRKKFIFQVSKLDKQITSQLKETVATYQNKGYTRIPISEINKIIESDFKKQQQTYYTLYIMKLSNMDEIYQYYETTSAICGTSIYVDTRQRFLWLDISTKQSSYGPHSYGEGMVAPFSIPNVRNYDTIPAQKAKQALLVDIVSFIEKTCDFLLGPSFHFFPALFTNTTPNNTVQLLLIVVHDHAVSPDMKKDMFDWEHIQTKIQQIAQLSGQAVIFKRVDLSLLTCTHCDAAFSYSLKFAQTAKQKTERYLDSTELHFWLQKFQNKIAEKHFVSGAKNLPIYLFDVSESELLLLDQVHQSVPFSDMTIAIQTQAGYIFTDMSCDMEPLWGRSDDATKSVLGSVLSTGWGVGATHEIWSNIHARPLSDYTWTIVNSPFEPFGFFPEISFAHQDAAVKHVLYSEIQDLFVDLNALFSHFLEYGRELDETLSPSESLQFLRRWNFLQFKLQETSRLMSLFEFSNALIYLLTTTHDIEALHKLIHTAGSRLTWDLLCSEPEPTSSLPKLAANVIWWCFVFSPLLLISLSFAKNWQLFSAKKTKSQ